MTTHPNRHSTGGQRLTVMSLEGQDADSHRLRGSLGLMVLLVAITGFWLQTLIR